MFLTLIGHLSGVFISPATVFASVFPSPVIPTLLLSAKYAISFSVYSGFMCLNKLLGSSLDLAAPPWWKHGENLSVLVVLVQMFGSRLSHSLKMCVFTSVIYPNQLLLGQRGGGNLRLGDLEICQLD